MCFSAESSFVSTALLAVITYACIKKTTSKRQYPLICMLGLYTLMQLIEGFEWLAFQRDFFPKFFIPFASSYFFFVSYFVWPLGMPVCTYFMETVPARKKKLKILCIVAGLMVLGVITAKIINPEVPSAKIVNNSIQYSFHIFKGSDSISNSFTSPAPFGIIFVIIFFLSMLFSSLKGKWIPFFLTFVSYAIAAYFYSYAFTSVWCFFASAVAASAYILLDLNKMKDEETTNL